MPAEIGGVDVGVAFAWVTGAGAIVGAAWAGVRAGLKKVQSNEADPALRFAGGVLMDNQSMMMLSERLRENTEAQRHLAHQIERQTDLMLVGRKGGA